MLKTTLGGRYQIIRQLGQGGFGTAFVAEDTQLPGNPQCVVKQLKPQASDPNTLQTARRLFETEAQILYQLGSHDRIPQLFAYFEENQEFYLVQEFIDGEDLSHAIAPGIQLSEDEVISLLQEILEILSFVHQQNVIHRDVNPRNLIRRKSDGQLILIDFGAVKQITSQIRNPQGQTYLSVSIGTPGYMPSEQAHGNPKQSSDIYAVGMIGIAALTGIMPEKLPRDPNTDEIVWKDLVTISPEFAKVLDKMVLYDFRQRYPSAAEALDALQGLKTSTLITIPLPTGAANSPVSSPPIAKSPGRIWKILVSVGLISAGIAGSIYITNIIQSANANDLFNRGNTLYNLKRYQEALAAYEKAIALKPDYLAAWYRQGNTLSELNQYEQALDAYEKAIQIQPDSVDAWTSRGYVLDQLKRFEAAIDSYNQALKLQPENAEAWNGIGKSLLNLQRYEEAIASYDQAVEYQPEYSEAWYNRGWALHKLERYQDAIASYDQALEFKPDDYQGWYNRANALLKLKDYHQAIESYDKALRLQRNHYQAWYSRANALSQLQQYPEAIASYEKAVELNPEFYDGWYNLGWSLHQLRRYQDAIAAYDHAIDLQPNNAQAWYSRGNTLYNLEQYPQAITAYDSAVYLQPEHYEAWYSRGNALFHVQRYPEAIASYTEAIRLFPDFRDAIKAQKKAERELEKMSKKSEKLELDPLN